MTKLSVFFATGICAALFACSGESSTGSSGGAGGAGGASGGGGGSSGAGAAAGAAGSAGSAGSGGVAGSAGSAGSGGGTANAGCGDLCAAITGAKCSGGPTTDGCLLTCKTLTSTAKCDPTGNAYMACVKSKGVTCNAAGDPVATGCGVDYLKAIDCAVKENPNPAIVDPCKTYCGKVQAAGCPSNAPEAECNSNCKWLGATGTGCDDEWSTFLTCANAANFSCLVGFAVAQGCGSQFTAYTKCVDAAGKT